MNPQANFLYSPQIGRLVLDAWGNIPDGSPPLSLLGSETQMGLMGALVDAEAYAAKQGFASPIVFGGQTGFIIGGGLAAAKQLGPDNPAAMYYLAQTNAVRRVLASTIPDTSTATPTSYAPAASTALVPAVFPLVPVVIAIAVVAVAASVAYWAYTDVEKVRIQSDQARTVGISDKVMQLAATGQPVDPNVLSTLKALAKNEQNTTDGIPWYGWVAIGGAIAGGIYIAVANPFAGLMRPRRSNPRRRAYAA